MSDTASYAHALRERVLAAGVAASDTGALYQTLSAIAPLLSKEHASAVVQQAWASMTGLGALDPLMEDPEITDVMVCADRGVWVERGGRTEQRDIVLNGEEILHIAERIVGPLGQRLDRLSPIVDARLADGSRVHVIIPPIAIDGPSLTIRRFGTRTLAVEEFVASHVAAFLSRSVKRRCSVLISGGTGAGKTTLLNALAASIGGAERIVTIEDAAELRLPHNHVVRLETRRANTEGVGEVTLRELVRTSLRMRPDRIIVGEVRGGEALDMLQAMNTGHEGSLSTCHANTLADALRRLETMVLMSSIALPVSAIREQIASAVDLVVQVSRTPGSSRRITSVGEVFLDGDRLCVNDLYRVGDAGKHEFCSAPTRERVRQAWQ